MYPGGRLFLCWFDRMLLIVAVKAVGCCTRIKCAEHNKKHHFEVEPECLYAGYMHFAAVDSVNLCAQDISIAIMYLGHPYSNTFICDTPESITLQ